MERSQIALKDIKKAYFIGIGGIGMSAIARFMNKRGIKVAGYDKTSTTLTKKLESEGMQINYKEDVDALPEQIDLVVYTPAVPKTHAELVHFQKGSVPVMKRAEVLGLLSRSLNCIGIAGTHGKTTTSTLLTYLLKKGGLDVSAFLGGISKDFKSNYVEGGSDWLVVEADEYDRSFLHLRPKVGSILSADPDHLDIYGNAEEILEGGFMAYAKLVEEQLFVQADYAEAFSSINTFLDYGIDKGQWRAENVRVEDGRFCFDFRGPDLCWKNLVMSLPGRHNIENAVLALSICCRFNLPEDDLRNALASFKGISRRFERIYEDEKVVYIDDYAHHPTELDAAILAARELFPDRMITGVFQPHLYSRTRDFVDGFASSLASLDKLYLLDIYPAREEAIPGVSSAYLFDKIEMDNKVLCSKETLLSELKKNKNDVLLTLGAGDIDTLVLPISNYLKTKL
jgi:UDP-N-acetylmuramate--alanine ligase